MISVWVHTTSTALTVCAEDGFPVSVLHSLTCAYSSSVVSPVVPTTAWRATLCDTCLEGLVLTEMVQRNQRVAWAHRTAYILTSMPRAMCFKVFFECPATQARRAPHAHLLPPCCNIFVAPCGTRTQYMADSPRTRREGTQCGCKDRNELQLSECTPQSRVVALPV